MWLFSMIAWNKMESVMQSDSFYVVFLQSVQQPQETFSISRDKTDWIFH